MNRNNKVNYLTKTKTILLTITESCNLSCVYCYEDFKSAHVMDLETAIRIIDKELSALPKGITLDVSYMGGEPFINFDLMKQIYEHYASVDNIKYTCSSNGTLVHGEIKDWVKAHFPKFSYNLSLDGNKYVQDHNRSNSFDQIDLDFYTNLYNGSGFVKMTLHPDTISHLVESVKFIHSLKLHPIANCAYGVDWTDQKVLDIYKEQLLDLIQFYLDNPEIKPCSLLDTDLRILAYDANYKPWCGIERMTVFSTSGKGFPCHFFQDITIGKELANKLPKLDMSRLIDYMDPVCQQCKFINLCPTCFGSNYKASGCFSVRDLNVCKTVKLQLYANAIFQLKRIEKFGISNLGLSDIAQKELYEGICKVYRYIDPENL